MITSNNKMYWVLQIFGWSLYALITSVFYLQANDTSNSVYINSIFAGISGLASSHILRSFIRRNTHQGKSAFLSNLSTLAISALLWECLLILFHVYVIHLYTLDSISPIATLFYYGYYFCILLIWMMFYLNIKSSQNRRESELDKLKLSLALKEAQLENLKWQINPHFLFNSLNSIRALISENPDNAKNMITKLAVLMRQTLNAPDKNLANLKEEFTFIENYLALEKIRFEERLDYSITLPASLENHLAPSLLIHTLVENGIKHGIAKLTEGGTIKLEALMKNNTLQIRVISSGTVKQPIQDGTGLRNSRERLKLAFGEQAKIEMVQYSTNTVLTTVSIDQ